MDNKWHQWKEATSIMFCRSRDLISKVWMAWIITDSTIYRHCSHQIIVRYWTRVLVSTKIKDKMEYTDKCQKTDLIPSINRTMVLTKVWMQRALCHKLREQSPKIIDKTWKLSEIITWESVINWTIEIVLDQSIWAQIIVTPICMDTTTQ